MQKVLYGAAAAIAALILLGFLLPSKHRVQVSVEIDAHPVTVFAQINDFRRQVLWSPLAESDPNARFIYSGNSRGAGAVMTWDGAVIGNGTQTIVESRKPEHVGIAISPGDSRTWFDLAPGTGTTVVTWGFEADYGLNIIGRYFASLLGSVIARDYEAGLANLKSLAESLPRVDFSDLEVEHLVVEAADIAYLETTAQPEPGAISEAMGHAYFDILNFIDRHGLQEAGAPLSITRSWSGAALLFDAAIPVRGIDENTPRNAKGVRLGQTYGGPAIRVKHLGSYRALATTHRKISSYLAALGIERNGPAWESYVSDPGKVPEAELITYVYYPVKPTL